MCDMLGLNVDTLQLFTANKMHCLQDSIATIQKILMSEHNTENRIIQFASLLYPSEHESL